MKFIVMAKAYSVTTFKISLIYAFIGFPWSVVPIKYLKHLPPLSKLRCRKPCRRLMWWQRKTCIIFFDEKYSSQQKKSLIKIYHTKSKKKIVVTPVFTQLIYKPHLRAWELCKYNYNCQAKGESKSQGSHLYPNPRTNRLKERNGSFKNQLYIKLEW